MKDGVQDVVPIPTDEKRSVALQGLDSSIDDIVVGTEQHLEIETEYVKKIRGSIARASEVEKGTPHGKREVRVRSQLGYFQLIVGVPR